MSFWLFLVFSKSFPRSIYYVSRLHVQVRIMGNYGLNDIIPWFADTEGFV